MEFEVGDLIHHPLEQVYLAYRDRLLELVPFLPNVDSVEILEREPVTDGVRLLNRWRVSGSIPRVARPFFSEQMTTYLDHARWRDAERLVEWRFEIGVVPEAVDCRGTNRFRPGAAPGTTEVSLAGRLAIDLAKVRGVPRLFHGLAPRVEEFILGRVRPNLVAVSRAVGKLLDHERR
jgi:hypothetical protein